MNKVNHVNIKDGVQADDLSSAIQAMINNRCISYCPTITTCGNSTGIESYSIVNVQEKAYNCFQHLHEYLSPTLKQENYKKPIETINDIDNLKNRIDCLSKEQNFIFRGVNEAKYMSYSSAQRYWIVNKHSSRCSSYVDFIDNIVQKAKANDALTKYFNNHNIPINDFEILATLQHYGMPSPLIDFSNDVYKALFFAFDKVSNSVRGDSLDDYVALYYANCKVDWLQCSLQRVEQEGASQVDKMIRESTIKNLDTSEYEKDTKEMTFSKIANEISFITIQGASMGNVSIKVPNINFQCNYNITNPRVQSQDGLFISNFTDSIPLIELINRIGEKFFHCIHIKKSLAEKVLKWLEKDKQITYNSIYCEEDDESQKLKKELIEYDK